MIPSLIWSLDPKLANTKACGLAITLQGEDFQHRRSEGFTDLKFIPLRNVKFNPPLSASLFVQMTWIDLASNSHMSPLTHTAVILDVNHASGISAGGGEKKKTESITFKARFEPATPCTTLSLAQSAVFLSLMAASWVVALVAYTVGRCRGIQSLVSDMDKKRFRTPALLPNCEPKDWPMKSSSPRKDVFCRGSHGPGLKCFPSYYNMQLLIITQQWMIKHKSSACAQAAPAAPASVQPDPTSDRHCRHRRNKILRDVARVQKLQIANFQRDL
ncbi:hypothetical protein DFH06DRAFT_1141075 [Mycena polygramma]|nr:hypothetical protein DFH06DRAFT_1141075 [Mycena polygramma]